MSPGIVRPPVGVIVRIWSEYREVLEAIDAFFKSEKLCDQSQILSTLDGRPKPYMLYLTRMGEMELFSWLITVSHDLARGYLTNAISLQGADTMHVSLELVY